MKVMVRSVSNFPSRTQRWKVQSSISTPLPFFFEEPPSPSLPPPPPAAAAPPPPDEPPDDSRSMMSLSLRPNLHSGIPVRKVFIMTLPDTSLRSTWPDCDMSRLTLSSTSMNTSFLR
jgi:hypothetical protein